MPPAMPCRVPLPLPCAPRPLPCPGASPALWGGRRVSDLHVGFPKVLRFIGSLGGTIPSASINLPCRDIPICPCPGYWGALGWGLLLLLALAMAPKTDLS